MSLTDTLKISSLKWLPGKKIFWLVVLLPFLLSLAYFGAIATDIYICESSFVLRSPEQKTASSLGLLLKDTGLTRSNNDGYIIKNFILSRDALQSLAEKMDIRASFGKGDFIARFPGLDWDDSFENFHRYYQRMIDVQVDPGSSVVTLTVRAFKADEAQRINRYLLEMSEDFVNRISERMRYDTIHYATKEVETAAAKSKAAALALARYRNEKGVIDPEREFAIPLQQIAKLQDELIAARTQLMQLQLLAKDNTQHLVLTNKIRLLEKEIERESMRMVGGNRSLASKVVEYEHLMLDKAFADKQLASAMEFLEYARNEAQRQQLYIERIAEPNLPDAAMEPRRVRNVLTTLVLGIIAWGVLTMIFAGIREHMD